jgi:hypothetical protein
MSLDSVTVGHVITVDFGPDRRSSVCKAWDWLQRKDAECGVRRYGFSAASDGSEWGKEYPVFTDTHERHNFKTGRSRVKAGLDWFCLLFTAGLFVAIEIYAG